MTTLTGLLVSEWLKGRGRPLDKFAGVIAVSLGALIPILMIVTTRNGPALRAGALEALAYPSSLRASATFLGIIGPLFAAALGANITGAEYQYGTWPWLLVRSSGRGWLFVAKVLIAAARTVVVAVMGVMTFALLGAVICMAMGAPVVAETTTRTLLASFTMVAGTMTFAASIALLVTVFARSVTVGVLVGATATPLMMALRFKETASWNFYLHLQNVQTYFAGQPTTALQSLYEFDMTPLVSLAILSTELLVILGTAYAVFRQQEIVY